MKKKLIFFIAEQDQFEGHSREKNPILNATMVQEIHLSLADSLGFNQSTQVDPNRFIGFGKIHAFRHPKGSPNSDGFISGKIKKLVIVSNLFRPNHFDQYCKLRFITNIKGYSTILTFVFGKKYWNLESFFNPMTGSF